ncbi:MAG: hypothetical protein U9Q76_04910 [candidate division WOR-3 bacterium]|nr:hypothetical protein [candidate division WOR-3 bacterium]
MKGRIAATMVALVAIAMLVGCAAVQKVKVPKVEKAPECELGGLYLTTDARQMTGVDRDHAKLAVGETVVIYARGMSTIETGGKWFELPADVVVTWKADRELEVTPATGHVVTVKVVEPMSVASFVTATTTTKAGEKVEKLFTVEGK